MISTQTYSLSGIVVTLYSFFLFSFVLHTLASPTLRYCRHDQRDALVEFKHEFPMNLGGIHSVYDMSSWNESSDCCSWETVECDAKGQVISFEISNMPLNNSLKPNSALFKLQYLQSLTLSSCNLYGEIPSSFGNLSHLTVLVLAYNKLVGQVPASIGNLTKLRYMSLNGNNLSGKISVLFVNLTKLSTLDIGYNFFEPELLPDMSRFHNLKELDLIFRGNHFKGPIDFGNLSLSSRLQVLNLPHNKFDGPIPETISKFLKLNELDLSNNKFEGKVPSCLWRLFSLKLSHNSFSSFGKSSQVLDQAKMGEFRLDSNLFQGPFPHWICKLRPLEVLDLSNNSFNGSIPPCFWNLISSLEVLILRNNNLSGILPDVFINATHLIALDVSRNQLEGKLPKSLISCKAMKLLNVGSNKFKDKFPSWLGSLPWLNALILRSNQFYGPLYCRHESIGFKNLKIIDVSQNDLSGTFPGFYFSSWHAMAKRPEFDQFNEHDDQAYMVQSTFVGLYINSMEMVHKGVYREFEKIRNDFIAIDFAENKFCGKVPESIGSLKNLYLLNLSGNAFTGNIPQSLANLIKLESLDLSRNQLVGRIPQGLGILSFLSSMNFSHNNLEGPIPQTTQFQRQSCSSFMGNLKLYNLEKICEKTHVPYTRPQESEGLSEAEEQMINWKAAAIAYGPGVFCGLVIGHIFVSHKHECFIEKFSRNKPRLVIRSTH